MKKIIFLSVFLLLAFSLNSFSQNFNKSLDAYLQKGNTINYLKDKVGISENGTLNLESEGDWVDIRNLPAYQVPTVKKNISPAVNTSVPTGNNGYSAPKKNYSNSGTNSFAKSFAKGRELWY